MSDFDTVLERLLGDPSFQAALAADPDAALAGYHLDADERDLLGTQLVSGDASLRTVETRTSKSGVVGLIGPVAAAFGVAASGLSSGPHGLETVGAGAGHGLPTGAEAIGSAPTGHEAVGSAPAGYETVGSAPGGSETLGSAPSGEATVGQGSGGTDSVGSRGGGTSSVGSRGPSGGGTGTETVGSAAGTSGAGGTESVGGRGDSTEALGSRGDAPVLAANYHTRVDVDGDGTWDAHTDYEDGHGGVEIVVDLNHDGRADFVGHDVNRDGLVDYADFDTNNDGVLDTRMYDDNGDGWMDRAERIPDTT